MFFNMLYISLVNLFTAQLVNPFTITVNLPFQNSEIVLTWVSCKIIRNNCVFLNSVYKNIDENTSIYSELSKAIKLIKYFIRHLAFETFCFRRGGKNKKSALFLLEQDFYYLLGDDT